MEKQNPMVFLVLVNRPKRGGARHTKILTYYLEQKILTTNSAETQQVDRLRTIKWILEFSNQSVY